VNINAWNDFQIQAASCLPSGFARRVVGQAARVYTQRRRENWLALLTAVFLSASITLQHWVTTANEQNQNLAQWRTVENQIETLETTL